MFRLGSFCLQNLKISCHYIKMIDHLIINEMFRKKDITFSLTACYKVYNLTTSSMSWSRKLIELYLYISITSIIWFNVIKLIYFLLLHKYDDNSMRRACWTRLKQIVQKEFNISKFLLFTYPDYHLQGLDNCLNIWNNIIHISLKNMYTQKNVREILLSAQNESLLNWMNGICIINKCRILNIASIKH